MLLKLLIAPLLLLLTCLLVSAHGAQAASCSASVSALDFGNVDTLSAAPPIRAARSPFPAAMWQAGRPWSPSVPISAPAAAGRWPACGS